MAHKINVEKQTMASHLMPAATAPAPPPYDAFVHRSPPPSYEESQQRYQAPTQGAYGYTNPYQAHMQQQQMYVMSSNNKIQSAPHVLQFAKGAVVNGSVTVPPPPPGCAATPAKFAAMQGQQVIIKKQKNTFF